MLFNKHSDLAGAHAFLSASKYHWINYDEEKLDRSYTLHQMARRGTDLHAFAHEAIRLGIKLPKSPKTMHLYVNDAIGFRMTPEQVLYYSPNCFGTADCISFSRNVLRIHDLKTGVSPTSVKQLMVYAALFCLEYRFKPMEITIELRIYQSNEVQIFETDYDEITRIMSKIISFDKLLTQRRMEDQR